MRNTFLLASILLVSNLYAHAEDALFIPKQPAKIIERATLDYPSEDLSLSHQGTTVASVEITALGEPKDARVVRYSGWPALDKAAMQNVLRNKYSPAIDPKGKPMASRLDVPVRFRINNAASVVTNYDMERLGKVWSTYLLDFTTNQKLLDDCGHFGIDNVKSKEFFLKVKSEENAQLDKIEKEIKQLLIDQGVDSDTFLKDKRKMINDLADKHVSEIREKIGLNNMAKNCRENVRSIVAMGSSYLFMAPSIEDYEILLDAN